MEFMFEVFPILFSLVFILVLGVIVFSVFRSFKQERQNDQSPRLTVKAKVVAKRTHFRRGSSTSHTVGHGYTTYFATFEVESGDRMELQLQGSAYGLVVEGDRGKLTFQGTRFLSFEREILAE